MQKQKLVYNHLLILGKSIPDTQKTIGYEPKKRPVDSTEMRTKTRLSSITPHFLIQVNFKPKHLKKTSAIKTAKEAI